MFFNDPFRDGQPQPRSFPLGGKEGLKNLLHQFSRDPFPRIAYLDGDGLCVVVMACLDRDFSSLRDRFGCIQQNVQKDLLQLLGIANNFRKMLVKLPDELLAGIRRR